MNPLPNLRIPLLLPLVLLLTAPALSQASADASASPSCRSQRLADVLHRLSDLVDLFAADPGRINADGYFGLRVSRDLLANAAARLADRATCGHEHLGLLNSILARQGLLARQFIHGLARKSRYDVNTYTSICKPLLGRIRQLIRGALKTVVEQRRQSAPAGPESNSSSESRATVEELNSWLVRYNESKGDQCLMEALRSDSVCSTTGATCSYLAKPIAEASGYYLTHQLIFKLTVALRCSTTNLPDKQAAVTAAADEMVVSCNKIFAEFKQIELANWTRIAQETDDAIVTALRDLYIEQAFLCGLLGDTKFYRRESLDTVASWQDPDLGCFKIFNSNLGAPQSGLLPSGFSRRRIQRDAEMLGGCSAHTSGLGMGFYANAVQFLAAIAD